MNRKLISLTLILVAWTSVVEAAAIDLTNTSGTTLSVEIQKVDGSSVTFNRQSDSKEFTIDLNMLDAQSQAQVREWEAQKRYNPESAPFFEINGEYVLPLEVTNGNQIRAVSTLGEIQVYSFPNAERLRPMADSTSRGSQEDPKSAFEFNVVRVKNSGETYTFVDDQKIIWVPKSIEDKVDLIPKIEAPTKLAILSYELFLPKNIHTEGGIGSVFSAILSPKHPHIQELESNRVNARYHKMLPATLEAGRWVKNQTVYRTYGDLAEQIQIKTGSKVPMGIRKMELTAIPDSQSTQLFTTDDLEEANVFISTEPFKLEQTSRGINVEPIGSSSTVDIAVDFPFEKGYRIEGVIEISGGTVLIDCMGGSKDIQTMNGDIVSYEKFLNIKIRKNTSGSAQEISFGFDCMTKMTPEIRVKGQNPIIHKFDVNLIVKDDAGDYNPLHK